jgi:hypothetical protein
MCGNAIADKIQEAPTLPSQARGGAA